MKREPPRALTAPRPAGEPSALLGTVGVARLLNVHPKHVYRLLHRGLPAHRLGGEWRYEREEVLAWVHQRGSTTAPLPIAAETGQRRAAPPLLAANGDVCVELLLRALAESTQQAIGFVPADRTSGQRLVEAGSVVAAGVHGTDSDDTSHGLVRIHVTTRQLGLAYPKRQRLRSLGGVTGRRLASRAPSTGIRAHFDAALREHGTDAEKAHRHAQLYESHRDVALAVLSGKADAGIMSLAWAERAGLSCLPFAEEDYSLCLRPDNLADPAGRAIVQALQGREIRKLLATTAGYDPTDAGMLRL